MNNGYKKPDLKSLYYDNELEAIPSRNGKTIAITGPTSGTGVIAAKTVAKKGAHVDPYKSGGLIGFICLLCYYKKQDDITNGKAQKCTVGELLEETRRGSRL